ncbi:sulfite exporter TauE/SafE family protein [Acinetobacter pecorum]|uniref:sulfite exporter TauE/SafE family protein n=1 Tax=Acinetobacter pecorum TaxID=2762215 RepID=UPI0011A65D8F
MSETFYLFFILIFIAAGLVKGITGMGLPTVAMGLLSILLPLPVAAALLVIPSLVTNVWQLFSGPSLIGILRRLWLMMLFIMLGTIGGAALLMSIDPSWSSFGLGIALIFYAGYALLSPVFIVPRKAEKWLSPAIGGITGLVTGATGVFVMPAVPYLQSLNFSKDELIQALGLSFSISTIALAIGLFMHSSFHFEQLSLSAVAIVPALLGMWVGQKIRAKISPKRFRQFFLLFLVILGLELILRPFL